MRRSGVWPTVSGRSALAALAHPRRDDPEAEPEKLVLAVGGKRPLVSDEQLLSMREQLAED